jgi:hypothetical protein
MTASVERITDPEAIEQVEDPNVIKQAIKRARELGVIK